MLTAGDVGDDVDIVRDRRVGQQGLRIDAGRGRDVLSEVADDAGHAGPVVVGADEGRVVPVLAEWRRLRSRIRGHRGCREGGQQEDGDEGDGGAAATAVDGCRHGEFSSWKRCGFGEKNISAVCESATSQMVRGTSGASCGNCAPRQREAILRFSSAPRFRRHRPPRRLRRRRPAAT